MKKPNLKQKVDQYERFLHNINMCMMTGNEEGVKKLLARADSWSYAHRVGDSLTEKEQENIVNKKFWNLCE